MRNELAEMKKNAQATSVSTNVWQPQKVRPTHKCSSLLKARVNGFNICLTCVQHFVEPNAERV